MDALPKANLILAGLAVGLGLPTFLVLRADANQFIDLEKVPKLFEGFSAGNVGRIIIGLPKPGQEPQKPGPDGKKKPVERDLLQFDLTDKGWVLGSGELRGAPVQTQRIEQELLKNLEGIRYDKQTLVAKDASDEALAQRDLHEEKAFVIQAMDRVGAQIVADLFIGKDASDPAMGAERVQGIFVRKSDSKDIVLYEVPYFRRSVKADEWIDKKVWQIEVAKATRLKIKSPATGGEELVFEKKPGSEATWVAVKAPPETGAIRQAKIEELIQRLQYVQAGEFRRPLQGANLGELGLMPPKVDVTISVKEKDGEPEKNYRFTTGNAVQDKTNEIYLTAGDSPFLMTWQSYMVQPFEANPKEWFDPPPGSVVEPLKEDTVPGKQSDDGKKGGQEKTDEARAAEDAKKGEQPKKEEPKKGEDPPKGGG